MKSFDGCSAAAKMALAIIALILIMPGPSNGTIPNLAGNWTGSGEGYQKGLGHLNVNESGVLTMNVSEQKDRLFAGNLTINTSSEHRVVSPVIEGFSGVIGRDNKTLYIAEYDKGYDIGTLISSDKIELSYIEDGKNACAFIISLARAMPHNNIS